MCLGAGGRSNLIILKPAIISNFYQMDSHIGLNRGGCGEGTLKVGKNF